MATAANAPKAEFVTVNRVEAGSGFYEYSTDVRNRIEKRAYELFENRGNTHGHDIDDWLTAERQILSAVPAKIEEAEHLYVITAEVSGFGTDELEVRVEPFRIFLTGTKRRLSPDDPATRPQQMLQRVELDREIDTHSVIAELSNGVLTVSMRKAVVAPASGHVRVDSSERRKHSTQLHKRADIAKRYAAAAREQLERATAKRKRAFDEGNRERGEGAIKARSSHSPAEYSIGPPA